MVGQGPVSAPPTVLVLTPVKDGVKHLDTYFAALARLSYPPERIALGFLESDSTDETFTELQRRLPALRQRYRRAELWKKDFGFQIPPGYPRWAPLFQIPRRTVLAKSRNHLLARALGDEEWVLWLDVDVVEYPVDVVERLLATGKDIVHPHCVRQYGGGTFDLNAWRQQGRLHMEDLRHGPDLVRLDAVGGTMLLVRADVHREGLVFPAYPYGRRSPLVRDPNPWMGREVGELDTEGLGIMAHDMGYQCWGLPNLEIRHADDEPGAGRREDAPREAARSTPDLPELAWRVAQALSRADRRVLALRLLETEADEIAFRRNGNRWTAFPWDHMISGPLFVHGGFEGREVRAVLDWMGRQGRLDPPRDVIIDVGANIGTSTIPFAQGTRCRVLAIEPVPDNFAVLCRNVADNGLASRVTCVQVAITTASHDRVRMILPAGNSGGGEVRRADAEATFANGWAVRGTVDVPTMPLAELLGAHDVAPPRVAFVWSDTQGCEAEVIESGLPLWTAGVPLFVGARPAVPGRRPRQSRGAPGRRHGALRRVHHARWTGPGGRAHRRGHASGHLRAGDAGSRAGRPQHRRAALAGRVRRPTARLRRPRLAPGERWVL